MTDISYDQLEKAIRDGVEGYLESEWDNIVDAITKSIMTSLAMSRNEDYRIMPDE